MKASRLIVMGVAVAAAGGAGYIAKQMAAAPPPPPVVANDEPAPPPIALTEVLVAADTLPVGLTIEGQLTWQSWPTDAVNEAFITKDAEPEAIDELNGTVVRISFFAGEPIRRAKLIGAGQSFMSSILPAGKRAMATQISADTAAGGFILPNDYVDVIMTRRDQREGAEGTFITETVLKNIRVLAIDQAIQEDEEGRKVKVGETATLELTPQQAEIITVAQQMADRLSLALRSTKDAQEKPDKEADYLLSGRGGGKVRIIKLGEISEVGSK